MADPATVDQDVLLPEGGTDVDAVVDTAGSLGRTRFDAATRAADASIDPIIQRRPEADEMALDSASTTTTRTRP